MENEDEKFKNKWQDIFRIQQANLEELSQI